MPLNKKDIKLLKEYYPWPDERPDFNHAEWVLDGGGRELIDDIILHNNVYLIIEIGVFLGSSVKRWLEVSPDVYVITIDPWDGSWWSEYARQHGRQELVDQFKRKDGSYMTFLSSLWEFRERVFPVRGFSPSKLYELSKLGVQPDLIYFDSDKTGEDLEIAHQLFPAAILTGDDWTWGVEEGYPIRKPVREFARSHGWCVRCNRATWVLFQGNYSLGDHLNNCVNFVKDQLRFLKSVFNRLVKCYMFLVTGKKESDNGRERT